MAAAGRLLVDLTSVVLDRTTPLALLDPEAPPLLPDPLPSSLEENTSPGEVSLHQNNEPDEVLLGHQGVIPGPTFDASVLKTPEQRTRFHRNLTAVTEVLTGGTLPQVAQKYEMTVSVLGRLVQRAKELGQIACVPYATYHRDRALRPEFQELIRKLYTHPMRPTIMAVYEDVGLKRLAEELSKREGTLVKTPTYRQVQYFLKEISEEAKVAQARSGLTHPPRERMSSQSFVLSISAPALICQVDEHILDQLVVTPDGTVITHHVHGAALICVKTAAILGAVLSLESLKGVTLRKVTPAAK